MYSTFFLVLQEFKSLHGIRGTIDRIGLKIRTAVPRVEKYKIGAAIQILETIHLILFHNDSLARGQSNMRRFIYESSATNSIRDWSLAYSSHMYILDG